jgi:hypothetical protein
MCVLGEVRDFFLVGSLHLAFASIAIKLCGSHKPAPGFNCRVAAMLTLKSEVHA